MFAPIITGGVAESIGGEGGQALQRTSTALAMGSLFGGKGMIAGAGFGLVSSAADAMREDPSEILAKAIKGFDALGAATKKTANTMSNYINLQDQLNIALKENNAENIIKLRKSMQELVANEMPEMTNQVIAAAGSMEMLTAMAKELQVAAKFADSGKAGLAGLEGLTSSQAKRGDPLNFMRGFKMIGSGLSGKGFRNPQFEQREKYQERLELKGVARQLVQGMSLSGDQIKSDEFRSLIDILNKTSANSSISIDEVKTVGKRLTDLVPALQAQPEMVQQVLLGLSAAENAEGFKKLSTQLALTYKSFLDQEDAQEAMTEAQKEQEEATLELNDALAPLPSLLDQVASKVLGTFTILSNAFLKLNDATLNASVQLGGMTMEQAQDIKTRTQVEASEKNAALQIANILSQAGLGQEESSARLIQSSYEGNVGGAILDILPTLSRDEDKETISKLEKILEETKKEVGILKVDNQVNKDILRINRAVASYTALTSKNLVDQKDVLKNLFSKDPSMKGSQERLGASKLAAELFPGNKVISGLQKKAASDVRSENLLEFFKQQGLTGIGAQAGDDPLQILDKIEAALGRMGEGRSKDDLTSILQTAKDQEVDRLNLSNEDIAKTLTETNKDFINRLSGLLGSNSALIKGLGEAVTNLSSVSLSLKQAFDQVLGGKAVQASGFVPGFAPLSPLARAVNTERALGGKPVVDYHNSIGTYVRDGATQKNFAAVKRDHPEGLSQAIKNSRLTQGAAGGFTPNFAKGLDAEELMLLAPPFGYVAYGWKKAWDALSGDNKQKALEDAAVVEQAEKEARAPKVLGKALENYPFPGDEGPWRGPVRGYALKPGAEGRLRGGELNYESGSLTQAEKELIELLISNTTERRTLPDTSEWAEKNKGKPVTFDQAFLARQRNLPGGITWAWKKALTHNQVQAANISVAGDQTQNPYVETLWAFEKGKLADIRQAVTPESTKDDADAVKVFIDTAKKTLGPQGPGLDWKPLPGEDQDRQAEREKKARAIPKYDADKLRATWFAVASKSKRKDLAPLTDMRSQGLLTKRYSALDLQGRENFQALALAGASQSLGQVIGWSGLQLPAPYNQAPVPMTKDYQRAINSRVIKNSTLTERENYMIEADDYLRTKYQEYLAAPSTPQFINGKFVNKKEEILNSLDPRFATKKSLLESTEIGFFSNKQNTRDAMLRGEKESAKKQAAARGLNREVAELKGAQRVGRIMQALAAGEMFGRGANEHLDKMKMWRPGGKEHWKSLLAAGKGKAAFDAYRKQENLAASGGMGFSSRKGPFLQAKPIDGNLFNPDAVNERDMGRGGRSLPQIKKPDPNRDIYADAVNWIKAPTVPLEWDPMEKSGVLNTNRAQEGVNEFRKLVATAQGWDSKLDPGMEEIWAGFSSGFIPNFNKMGEVISSIAAGYKNPVGLGDVKSMNIPGVGKSYYNNQETVMQAAGMQQPFIVPPKSSRASSSYANEVKGKFGFDPYKSNHAQGFVPNLFGPNTSPVKLDSKDFKEETNIFKDAVNIFKDALAMPSRLELNLGGSIAVDIDIPALQDAVKGAVQGAVSQGLDTQIQGIVMGMAEAIVQKGLTY